MAAEWFVFVFACTAVKQDQPSASLRGFRNIFTSDWNLPCRISPPMNFPCIARTTGETRVRNRESDLSIIKGNRHLPACKKCIKSLLCMSAMVRAVMVRFPIKCVLSLCQFDTQNSKIASLAFILKVRFYHVCLTTQEKCAWSWIMVYLRVIFFSPNTQLQAWIH